MAKNRERGAVIGVSDHGGWAVLVTVARDGTLLDRRRVELVGEGLPKIPHHSECQRLPVHEAVELVERVRVSAERHAVAALDAVAMEVPGIAGIALRACQPLPPTIAERITDYRAQNVADWVMYRKALAAAAEARGWAVCWYNGKSVLSAAQQTLGVEDLDGYFLEVRKAVGPPWNADHKLAMAAAVVAGSDCTEEYEALMQRLSYVKAGRKFTREEMNERQGNLSTAPSQSRLGNEIRCCQ